MASILNLSTLLLLFFFFPMSVLASAQNYTDTGVVVQGTVYCQDCATRGSWSLTGAKPLPGAKVSIQCRDYKHRVRFYLVAPIDKNGYFFAPLTGLDMKTYKMDKPNNACTVHLVSSSDKSCNRLSNINYGIRGAPIRYESKLFNGTSYEADLYSTWPLAFRPNQCRPVPHYH